jgi:hypothetical protein
MWSFSRAFIACTIASLSPANLAQRDATDETPSWIHYLQTITYVVFHASNTSSYDLGIESIFWETTMTTAGLVATATACLLACTSMSGFAHSGGNSGMGGNAGGMSAGHMSSEGASNTNSPLAGDRNLGRAARRTVRPGTRTRNWAVTVKKERPSLKAAKSDDDRTLTGYHKDIRFSEPSPRASRERFAIHASQQFPFFACSGGICARTRGAEVRGWQAQTLRMLMFDAKPKDSSSSSSQRGQSDSVIEGRLMADCTHAPFHRKSTVESSALGQRQLCGGIAQRVKPAISNGMDSSSPGWRRAHDWRRVRPVNQEGPTMDIIRVGIDLAKNVFQVHGVDRTEKTVWRRKLACDEWLDIQMARRRTDALSLWVMRIVANRHPNVAAVALANKTARIAWAMITREMDYQPELAAQ